MRYAAGNAQHIGARKQQQDAFGFSDPGDKTLAEHGGFLGVVADGMGGLTNGSEASAAAVRSFLQAYKLKTAKESIADALSRSLQEANHAVLQVAGSGSPGEVGTTLAAAVVHSDSVHWIAAGDSRIYWLQGMSLTRLNAEHIYAVKLNREAVEGKISRAQARSDPQRASLTSYLGQPEPELVDHNQRPLTMQPDDCVILCSDGLYRGLTEGEMASAFHHDLQHGCDSLVRQVLAKQRNEQDNLTIIALKAGTRSRLRERHPARMALTALMVLLLVFLSGGAAYWYLKQSTTVEPKPAAGQGSGPGQIVTSPGTSDVTTPDTNEIVKPPQTNPESKVVKPPVPLKKTPPPKKKSSPPPKPKPEPPKQGTGDQQPPPPDTAPPPSSPPTLPQQGDALAPTPANGQPGDATKDSQSPTNKDKDKEEEKDKKQTSPVANPGTDPNSTTPPPSNTSPPDTKPNPPNLATALTKGTESLCRS